MINAGKTREDELGGLGYRNPETLCPVARARVLIDICIHTYTLIHTPTYIHTLLYIELPYITLQHITIHYIASQYIAYTLTFWKVA